MPDTGPHITAALLCERVITEADGVLSFMRVVDRIMNVATGIDPPDEMPPMVGNIQMVVALKSDRAKGRHTVKFLMEAPDGASQQIGEQDVNFTPGNAGANLVIGLQLGLALEGVYWIDVVLGGPRNQPDVLLTRTPLEVVYQRQRIPGPPSLPAPEE
jgi:hypothetical protein